MFLKQCFKFFCIITVLLVGHLKLTFAATCCAGGGGQSICILPAEQRYQLGLSNTYRSIQGEFDPYGNYSSNKNGNSSEQMTTVVGGAYRLNDDWQFGLSIPFTTNQQKISDNSKQASAMGDPSIEGRYLYWEDLAFLTHRPQLTFYAGVRLPLGTSVYSTTDPYALDAVGDGTTTIHIGLGLAKLFRPVKISFDGAYFYPLSHDVDKMRGQPVANPYQMKLGNRFQFSESLTYLFSERWSSAVGFRQLWVLQSSINGNEVDSSAQRLYSSLLSLNYSYDNSWDLALSFDTAFPFYDFEANQPYSQSMSLALTYGGI